MRCVLILPIYCARKTPFFNVILRILEAMFWLKISNTSTMYCEVVLKLFFFLKVYIYEIFLEVFPENRKTVDSFSALV